MTPPSGFMDTARRKRLVESPLRCLRTEFPDGTVVADVERAISQGGLHIEGGRGVNVLSTGGAGDTTLAFLDSDLTHLHVEEYVGI
jgi:hypothetical protein